MRRFVSVGFLVGNRGIVYALQPSDRVRLVHRQYIVDVEEAAPGEVRVEFVPEPLE